MDSTTSDASDLKKRLFFRLLQSANAMNNSLNGMLADSELTVQRSAVLGCLTADWASTGVSVGDMANYLRVSRQNLTVILSQMAAAGLIGRVADIDDKRRKIVVITTRGKKKWAATEPIADSFYTSALSSFSTDDQIAMTHLLNKLLVEIERLDSS